MVACIETQYELVILLAPPFHSPTSLTTLLTYTYSFSLSLSLSTSPFKRDSFRCIYESWQRWCQQGISSCSDRVDCVCRGSSDCRARDAFSQRKSIQEDKSATIFEPCKEWSLHLGIWIKWWPTRCHSFRSHSQQKGKVIVPASAHWRHGHRRTSWPYLRFGRFERITRRVHEHAWSPSRINLLEYFRGGFPDHQTFTSPGQQLHLMALTSYPLCVFFLFLSFLLPWLVLLSRLFLCPASLRTSAYD